MSQADRTTSRRTGSVARPSVSGGELRRFDAAAKRSPALTAAAALAAGIAIDRWCDVPFRFWMIFGAVAAVLCVASPLPRGARIWFGTIAIVVLLACVGGARHHFFWSMRPADDIQFFARESRQLVRLVGRIASTPAIRPARPDTLHSSWARVDHSRCLLECRTMSTDSGDIPVSGVVRLEVDGHLLHLEIDDDVEVMGFLSLPRGPSNPGDADSRELLRTQGASCFLSADHPDAVRRINRTRPLTAGRLLSRLRSEAESVFVRGMSRERVPLATALLLGDRSGLSDEVRDAFARSGMMHVLAISGLNVGILAAMIWPACRLLNASPRMAAVGVVLTIVSYTCLTEAAAPVVRAAVLVTVMALGVVLFRRVSAANALGLAALGLLLCRPGDLFDVGAQLSFLAVGAMAWAGAVRSRRREEEESTLEPERTIWESALLRSGRAVKEAYILMGAIWLFTLPLTMHRFHLISLVAVLINVALIPLITVVMWLGYLTLIAGLLVPQSGVFVAPAFDWGLGLFVWLIEQAALPRYGHLFAPGPSLAWVAGYYMLLAMAVIGRASFLPARIGWGTLAVWTAAGLLIGLRTPAPEGLRCTFLSVGHGLSVLVETPNGGTLLYDGGSIQNADRARWAVQRTLWERGHARVDAAMISHADIDHFNGLPGLVRSVPVGRVLTTRQFLDFRQPSVVECCEACFEARVPIRLVSSGDEIGLDDDVEFRLLHPAANESSEDDNANSVVLLIQYRGRRILLTGDLEKSGTARLLSQPSLDVDVLLAPHHGSVAASPKELTAWCAPEWVVASCGGEVNLPALRKCYPESTQVLATSESGAVTVSVSPSGKLEVVRHRGGGEPSP